MRAPNRLWKDKKVYVKRHGDSSRCLTTENTLFSWKTATETDTKKPLQSQELLLQERNTDAEAKLVPLKSDRDVKRLKRFLTWW